MSLEPNNHYAILEVSEDATEEEIRAAYKRLVFKHHPDRNRYDVAAAHQATIAINLAWEILRNEGARRNFDDFRRRQKRRPTEETRDRKQQWAYEKARRRYQESEEQARQRVRKWFDERLSVRSTKNHRCYLLQGNETTLDNFVAEINTRLGDKVWEYRITSVPDSGDRMAYRIRVVCDPSKCSFREYHSDWVQDYYYGIFKPGTRKDAAYNERVVRLWLGDILDRRTYSNRIHVFFGVVGETQAPWRCYVDLSVLLPITAFDAFFHASVPGLSRFGKAHISAVASKFAQLAKDTGITPVELCQSQTKRRDLARRAENVLRAKRGMRILREWTSVANNDPPAS